jgi:large subunit ribosomal protein L10
MSKVIKQMQMDALKRDFNGVRDMVLLNIVGLDAIAENQVRLNLRKKGIRLQLVKNSLARRVFKELGLSVLTDGDAKAEKKRWTGSTTVAWGGTSIAELSKELETIVKKYEKKMKVKTAVSDGQEVPFAVALKMPTKQQIQATILGMILSPGSQIASQIVGPATQIAGQLKTLSEKKEEAPAAPPA